MKARLLLYIGVVLLVGAGFFRLLAARGRSIGRLRRL